MSISSPVVRDLRNRFISIDFPTERTIESVSTVLRERYQDNILIINMSEREYSEELLPGHVIVANFRGLPAPPLETISRLCLQIHQWLSRSPSNVVAVHCFPGLSRSAVLISCYLAWSGAVQHPVDALVDVCAGLKIDVESSSILPSQKRYLQYFNEFLIGNPETVVPSEPDSPICLTRLILSGLPNLPVAEGTEFRPFFEIWKDGRLVQTSLPTQFASVEEVPSYAAVNDSVVSQEAESSVVVSFEITEEVPLTGDFLFRIRHLTQNCGRFTCLRFAVNSQYISNNVLHLGKHEIDGNGFSHCMVDAVFKACEHSELNSQLIKEEFKQTFDVLKLSKETSDKLRSSGKIEEDTDAEIREQDLLLKVLGKNPSQEPAPQIMGQSQELSGDEVDDFFAQLEKEAQI